jgi:orotate phosphoribosyltransferase
MGPAASPKAEPFEQSVWFVVEDVVTSGGQIIESVCSLREQGGIIETAVCVIDRQAGGPVNLKKYGVSI